MFSAKSFFIASLMVIAMSGISSAQQATPPGCNGPHASDFDFWVGEWNVYAPDGGPYQGRNSITKAHGGCLVSEHWTGGSGSTGESMNFYDPLNEAWRQVWVSAGVFIDYSGGLNEDGAMELTGEIYYDGTGQRAPFRGVWTLQEDGSVRQHFQQADDEGNWSDWFVGIYVRQESDPRAAEAAEARGE